MFIWHIASPKADSSAVLLEPTWRMRILEAKRRKSQGEEIFGMNNKDNMNNMNNMNSTAKGDQIC